MTLFLTILAPISGILGVGLGVLLNELLRRKNRRELYAPKIFDKKLETYEGLAELIQQGSDIARKVIETRDLTADQRHELISIPISTIANYVDRHRLYLDEEIGSHCIALFMGVEDIYDATENEKPTLLKEYYNMHREAYRMIAEDSGVAEINKLFKAIRHIIERIRELRREAK
jgi:hypothetical protein